MCFSRVVIQGAKHKNKRKQYQTEQRNVFTIKTLHFSFTNALLTDRLVPGWHTRRRTWPGRHRLFLSGMILPPLPSCSLSHLPKLRAHSTTARAQAWPSYAKNVALRSPSAPADECPSFPQSHSAPAVSQGSLESPELRKTQDVVFTRQSWVTTGLCWTSCSFPSQACSAAPQKQEGLPPHPQDKGMVPPGLQEGWCGALCFPSPPVHQLGQEGFLRPTTKGRRHRVTGLTLPLNNPSRT